MIKNTLKALQNPTMFENLEVKIKKVFLKNTAILPLKSTACYKQVISSLMAEWLEQASQLHGKNVLL